MRRARQASSSYSIRNRGRQVALGGASSGAVADAVDDLAATSAPSSAVLAWSAPPNNGSEITDYIVQYQPT